MKKKKLNKKNLVVIYLFSAAVVLLSAIIFYNYSSSAKGTRGSGSFKSIYIDDVAKNLIQIDSSSKDFNRYRFTSSVEGAQIILSKERHSGYELLDSFDRLYIPIVSWANYEVANITNDDLASLRDNSFVVKGNQKLEFIFFDKYKNDYTHLLGSKTNIGELKNIDDLATLRNNKNFISFVDIKDMAPYFKYLTVEGKSPLLKNNNDYSLFVPFYLETDAGNSETLALFESKIKDYKKSLKVTDILSVGDIMLSRDVGIKIRKSKDNSLPFNKLGDFLSKADITFGNLESPFYNQGAPLDIGMSFKANPDYIEGISFSGFDILSLANNHFGNQGRLGMQYTFSHLLGNNIKYCGAGNNIEEAHNAAVINKNDKSLSFLSYNSIQPQSYEAGTDLAGLAYLYDTNDSISKMKKDIGTEKDKGNIVVVSFHWGSEYTPKASDFQKKIAKEAIAAGADTIIAQHPHVVQGLDFIEDKPVLYSLGNFVFDQMWSQETREGLILKTILVNNKIVALDLLPVIIDDYNQPRFAIEAESNRILKRVIDNSSI
ncbi:CapA family protein [bacterium]|nr:CapA family protein [bacterium]